MRIAVSSIAWQARDDSEVARRLRDAGVSGVEIAPTTVWPDLTDVRPAEARAHGDRWARAGLPVVAAQSLLYGRPELRLFDPATRTDLLDYLGTVIDVCAAMGATALVFGSPKNRRRDGLDADAARRIAVDAFGRLAARAAAVGTCLVLEANPVRYGADYLTHAAEAADLVRAVDAPGLRLHLDTACMALAEDDAVKSVHAYAVDLRHVHLSAVDLGPVGDPDPAHPPFAEALRDTGYAHWVSVEMRRTEDPVEAVERAARYAVAVFG